MATFDEELSLLEETVRRLKIEYDVYFAGGSKRPPNDTEWRVQTAIKRLETPKLTFAQRFRYNTVVQKYAIFSDLWRQKLKIKEAGYRRPQDALLAIQGLRGDHASESTTAKLASRKQKSAEPFRILCSNPESEHDVVRSLFVAVTEARRKAGEKISESSFDSFHSFVKQKTQQIRKQYGCDAVEYAVEVNDGQVRLKAKAKPANAVPVPE